MIGTNFGYNTLRSNGDTKNSLNFIFLSEGFTAADMPKFDAACIDKMNTILAEDPWKSNSGNINFYSVPVISPQSGITHKGGLRDCPALNVQGVYSNNSYFGLAFDCANTHRFILPTTQQAQLINATVIASVPFANSSNITSNVEPIIICQDSAYGGSEWGSIAVTTLNSNSNEVLKHELGHVMGLNDEYIGGSIMESYNTTQPVGLNPQATYTADLSQIRWGSVLKAAVEIGSEPLYKPTTTCKMNTLGVGYCIVCSTQIVNGIGQLIKISGGTPHVPLVYPPVTPPNPNNPDISNSGGISIADPNKYPSTNSVMLQCTKTPNTNIYVYHLFDSTGKTELQHQQAISPNNVVLFSGLTTKTTYLVYVQSIYPVGHSNPSTFFQFTTK